MDNEYLQEKVMGECVHTYEPFRQRPKFYKCSICDNVKKGRKQWTGCIYLWLSPDKNRDFSTPTDYCALEDKMGELGWWGFNDWLWLNDPEKARLEARHEVVSRFHTKYTRTQRAALMAEYWRQK